MVFVYVIRSTANGRRYVGIAKALGARLRQHARGGTKGGQQLGEFELIHREEFPTYTAARVREEFLKSGQGRKWLDEQFGRHANIDSGFVKPTLATDRRGVA